VPKGFASARFTDRVKLARLCGDSKGPGHRDTDNPFIENEQSIASSDSLVGLYGVVGIAGARRTTWMAPRVSKAKRSLSVSAT
jgi:hypothetical protein